MAEKKEKRSVVKRRKKEEAKEARKNSREANAILREQQSSPRKMNLVAEKIRRKPIGEALDILRFSPQAASGPLEKLLLNAINNWSQKHEEEEAEEAGLVVKEVVVNGGRMLKRLQPAPQGRAYRIRKRSCHVHLRIGPEDDESGALQQVVDAVDEAAGQSTETENATTGEESNE